MSRLEAVKRIIFGTPQSVGGTVYGTVVVMGAVTAGSDPNPRAGELAVIVATTVLVLWIAHVYSHSLAETIQLNRRLDRREFADVARREWAIPLAAVGPVAVLVLGGLGLLRDATAIWISLGVGLAVLAVEGVRYAGVESMRGLGVLVTVGLNVALGLVIVGLKVAVAH